MSNSRMRLSNRADDKPHNSSKGKGIILETPYKPGFIDDSDLETVKMAVDKELSDISNAFYQTIERTADTITRVDKLEISGDTQYGELNAKIEEVDRVSKENDVAMAQRITTISAEVGDNKSAITTESTARAEGDRVLTERIDTILGSMEGDLGPLVGQFQEQIRVLGENDTILTERITTLDSEYKTADGDIKASIKNEETARVTADQALTSQINTATSKLDKDIASVQQYATTEITKTNGNVSNNTAAVNKINAKWGVQVVANDKIAGIQLNNDGKTATFSVMADKFTVSSGSNAVIPFEVTGNETRIRSLYVNKIQSDNYSSTAGWAINRDGNAVFNNVTVRGNVEAKTFSGVGSSCSLGGASYGSQQSGTTEIALNSFTVPNNTNEVIQCAIMMFGLELSGQIEVIFKVYNTSTGSTNSMRIRNNLASGEYTTVSAMGYADIPANSTQSVRFSVQKVSGSGWWSAPYGYAYKSLHRKF